SNGRVENDDEEERHTMLIRPTDDGTFECIYQEHHGLLSGVLAGAWTRTRLDPLLVQAIGLHDNPWRGADARVLFNEDTGLPHDFMTYPHGPKFDFYRAGIDELERVDPFVAYLVSRHYTTFAGTRNADALTAPEEERRLRLSGMLSVAQHEELDEALSWTKFFDVFSLYLCLTGPRSRPEDIPSWLLPAGGWTTAPDFTELTLDWLDDETLSVSPWPFATPELSARIYFRLLGERVTNTLELESQWSAAEQGVRDIVLLPTRGERRTPS
ncbi:MAG: DUF3891 family protein, partial [Bradymonadaceae bacterium]